MTNRHRQPVTDGHLKKRTHLEVILQSLDAHMDADESLRRRVRAGGNDPCLAQLNPGTINSRLPHFKQFRYRPIIRSK